MADMDYDDYNSEEEFDSGKKQRKSTAGRKLMRWNRKSFKFTSPTEHHSKSTRSRR